MSKDSQVTKFFRGPAARQLARTLGTNYSKLWDNENVALALSLFKRVHPYTDTEKSLSRPQLAELHLYASLLEGEGKHRANGPFKKYCEDILARTEEKGFLPASEHQELRRHVHREKVIQTFLGEFKKNRPEVQLDKDTIKTQLHALLSPFETQALEEKGQLQVYVHNKLSRSIGNFLNLSKNPYELNSLPANMFESLKGDLFGSINDAFLVIPPLNKDAYSFIDEHFSQCNTDERRNLATALSLWLAPTLREITDEKALAAIGEALKENLPRFGVTNLSPKKASGTEDVEATKRANTSALYAYRYTVSKDPLVKLTCLIAHHLLDKVDMLGSMHPATPQGILYFDTIFQSVENIVSPKVREALSIDKEVLQKEATRIIENDSLFSMRFIKQDTTHFLAPTILPKDPTLYLSHALAHRSMSFAQKHPQRSKLSFTASNYEALVKENQTLLREDKFHFPESPKALQKLAKDISEKDGSIKEKKMQNLYKHKATSAPTTPTKSDSEYPIQKRSNSFTLRRLSELFAKAEKEQKTPSP